MTYRNKKTGRVVVVTSEVIGEEWEKVVKKSRAEKPKPAERKAKGKATS